MKRYFSVFMALLCLFTCISTIALADDDDLQTETPPEPIDIVWTQIQQNSNQYDTQTALNIQYDNESSWIYLTGTPQGAARYWLKNQEALIQQFPGMGGEVVFRIDYKFDDSHWHSEKTQESGVESECATLSYTLQPSDDNQFAIPFCNLAQYTPEQDANEMFMNIAQKQSDGKYSIDFTQHTLSIKISVIFRFAYNNTIREIEDGQSITSIYSNGNTDVIAELQAPEIQDSFYGFQEKALLFQLTPAPITYSLAAAGHDIQLELQYSIDDETQSDIISLPYQWDEYNYMVYLTQLTVETDGEPLQISCRWKDNTTQKYSDWTFVWPNLIATLQDVAGIDTSVIPHFNASCRLCNICKMPGGLCAWIWTGCGLCLAIAITSIIMLFITKYRNTSKEKETCTNKNSKTHK